MEQPHYKGVIDIPKDSIAIVIVITNFYSAGAHAKGIKQVLIYLDITWHCFTLLFCISETSTPLFEIADARLSFTTSNGLSKQSQIC